MKYFIGLLIPFALALSADPLPPYVLIGTGKLTCNISSQKDGLQRMDIHNGSGISFDVDVTPIIDGIIKLKKLKPRLNYRFTSNLSKVRSFEVTGFGPVKLLNMQTKVSINAHRFSQPAGPGTSVSFTSNDMDRKGMYVEFSGKFIPSDSKQHFAFRTILGPPTSANGSIIPHDSNDTSRIMAKRVVVEIEKTPSTPYSTITTTIVETDP